MKIVLYIVSCIILILTSCKKVQLEPTTPSTSPEPVFSAAVVVNGNTSLIDVGENATLTSYHHVIGNGSYFGSTFTDISGNDLLSFEFGLIDALNSTSLSSAVNFGSLTCNLELDITNIQTNVPVSLYGWTVDGVDYFNTNAILQEYGVHDVVLLAILVDGTEVILMDRVVLGGVELNEPNIVISEISSTEFSCFASNVPTGVDNVVWEIVSEGSILLTSTGSNFQFDLPIPIDNFIVNCKYYSDGELVNYSSKMQPTQLFPSAPSVSFGTSISSLENTAIPNIPFGKVSYNHNGVIYSTRDNSTSTFSMSDMVVFIDEYTAETYLKGEMVYSSYLHNLFGDSIYVEVSSQIGFKEIPD